MKQTRNGTYVLGDRWADYDWLMEVLRDTVTHGGEMGMDVETKTARRDAKVPDVWRDTLAGIGIAPCLRDENGDEHFIPIYGAATDDYLGTLQLVYAQQIPWYAHNAMFDAIVLARYGVRLGEHAGDPRIIAYLLGEPDATLKTLLQRWFPAKLGARIISEDPFDLPWETYEELEPGIETLEYHDLLDRWGAEDITQVPIEEQADYCALQDAMQCVRLAKVMERELEQRTLDLYHKVELPMVNILVSMTMTGIRFDRERAQPWYDKETRDQDNLDAAIAQMVRETGFVQFETRGSGDKKDLWRPVCKVCRNGSKKREGCMGCGGRGKLDPVEKPFNCASTTQMQQWLYDHMHAPVRRFAGGRSAWQAKMDQEAGEEVGPATDTLALLQCQDLTPAIPVMLVRKKISKRVGMLRNMLAGSEADHRLHGKFTNTKVGTGRLSSFDPNMQQIPADLRVLMTGDE